MMSTSFVGQLTLISGPWMGLATRRLRWEGTNRSSPGLRSVVTHLVRLVEFSSPPATQGFEPSFLLL